MFTLKSEYSRVDSVLIVVVGADLSNLIELEVSLVVLHNQALLQTLVSVVVQVLEFHS
jgi:hypothetical protein